MVSCFRQALKPTVLMSRNGCAGHVKNTFASPLRSRNWWAVLLAHICFCSYVHTAMNWLPSFFLAAPLSVPLKELPLYRSRARTVGQERCGVSRVCPGSDGRDRCAASVCCGKKNRKRPWDRESERFVQIGAGLAGAYAQ
eukprot:gene17194-biopygen14387